MTTLTIRRPNRALRVMEPFYRPMDIFDDIERFAGNVQETWPQVIYADHMHPRLDMYEQGDELVMTVELPGIKREDIDVSLEGDKLDIKAVKKQEKLPEGAEYYTSERNFGTYWRTITLPFEVNAGKISSTFENGLLEIRLPKAEEAKAKHIEVKVPVK